MNRDRGIWQTIGGMVRNRRQKNLNLGIFSDGTPHGTKVFDEDTGEEIMNACAVEFRAGCDGMPPEAKITVFGAYIELEARARVEYTTAPGELDADQMKIEEALR